MTAMKKSKCKCQMQLWGMLGCILLTTACKQTNEQPLAGGNYETMKVTVSNQELNTAYSATIRGDCFQPRTEYRLFGYYPRTAGHRHLSAGVGNHTRIVRSRRRESTHGADTLYH